MTFEELTLAIALGMSCGYIIAHCFVNLWEYLRTYHERALQERLVRQAMRDAEIKFLQMKQEQEEAQLLGDTEDDGGLH